MRPSALLLLLPIIGTISLDRAMTREEKEQTGVADLNYSQKRKLEQWIDANYEEKKASRYTAQKQLYLSLNIDNGSRLELSDGKTYQIAPEDREYTMYWITPFPIRLTASGDKDYPVRITNMKTGTSVLAKEISTRALLEKDRDEKAPQLQAPKQQPHPSKQKEPKSQ